MVGSVYQCPHCGEPFRVPENGIDVRLQCPHCYEIVQVPASSSSAEALKRRPAPPAETTVPLSGAVACPGCDGRFKLDPAMVNQRIACPHCQLHLDVTAEGRVTEIVPERSPGKTKAMTDAAPLPQIDISGTRDARGRDSRPVSTASESSHTGAESVAAGDDVPSEGQESAREVDSPRPLDPALARMLPPKFIVGDAAAPRANGSHVILPDSQGGFRAIDTSVRQLRIGHQTVAIVKIPEATKRRRRLTRTALTIAICGILLFVVLRLLLR